MEEKVKVEEFQPYPMLYVPYANCPAYALERVTVIKELDDGRLEVRDKHGNGWISSKDNLVHL